MIQDAINTLNEICTGSVAYIQQNQVDIELPDIA
jgi:hypothetical protein